jgi:NADH-quinone oxidoreductase E subunit
MTIAFSAQAARKIEDLVKRYPDPQAACIPTLHLAQDEFGHLSDEVIALVAGALKLPEAHVLGVATFYAMFHRHEVGKKYLMVCTNISCMLRGAYDVLALVEKRLGIKPGETSKEGVTLVEEECLAACADAPMAICEKKYFLRLDEKSVNAMIDEILRDAAAGRPTTELGEV